MATQIIIKKTYFDNIKVAIDAMNNFFASGFKTKAFPVVNDDFQLDRIIARTLSWLNNIEPSWIEDPQKAVKTLDQLKAYVDGKQPLEQKVEEADETDVQQQHPPSKWDTILNGTDKVATDMFHAFIGFKVLQYITNNFDQFENLMNGIYSFELFTKPSQYRTAIETFTKAIPMPELNQIEPFPGEYKLFDTADYIGSIFDNDQIKLPEDMMAETETQRFQQFTDLPDVEIVIDEAVQEAAAVNYFTDTKPEHIKYNPKTKKWKISKQFESAINKLTKKLRECDDTDAVAEYLSKFGDTDIEPFVTNVIPFILANIFTMKKNKWNTGIDKNERFQDYAKSYSSINRKNAGARRFARYDIFSTFKTDKEGTIKFLEDFLKLNLVNDPSCAISNNILLTLFNIFDSRIYLDILYNLIPDEVKEKEEPTEDGFVKKMRARINQNSRAANPYQKEKKVKDVVETSEEVTEAAYITAKEFGDMSLSDMQYCEAFHQAIYDEIDSLGDKLYNEGISSITIDQYIGESYLLDQIVQELETGDIPNYMRERIALSDDDETDDSKKKPQQDPFTIPDTQLPPDVPINDFEDLADSINARLDAPDAKSLGDMLGSGYNGAIKQPAQGGHGTVIYNITNNYTNSHNTTNTTTTTNDLSTGKTTNTNVSNVHNDLSSNKQTIIPDKNKGSNNYDNTRPSSDTKESPDTFSNGKSVHEVFALLDSEEPLFVESDAGTPPTPDLLTTAMDADKDSLPRMQEAKRRVTKAGNTIKAVGKPITRVRDWLRKTVDSFVKRDEDRVKRDLVENPSYRSALRKACRIALKAGLFSVFRAISPWLGIGYLGIQGLKLADRERLRREANDEITTEIRIIDQKIKNLEQSGYYNGERKDPNREKKMYQLMRQRQKLVQMLTDANKRKIATSQSVY